MVKKIVKCTPEYWEFVRTLRNDDRVQSGFIHYSNITKEQQEEYMRNHFQYYRVCLVDDTAAGYVGVIEDDIRICTHPDYQNIGVGKFMLSEIMKEFPNAYGKVKIDNVASKNLFQSLGFKESFIIFTR